MTIMGNPDIHHASFCHSRLHEASVGFCFLVRAVGSESFTTVEIHEDSKAMAGFNGHESKTKTLPVSTGFVFFLPTENFQRTVNMGWAVPLKVSLCPLSRAPVVLPRCPTYRGK